LKSPKSQAAITIDYRLSTGTYAFQGRKYEFFIDVYDSDKIAFLPKKKGVEISEIEPCDIEITLRARKKLLKMAQIENKPGLTAIKSGNPVQLIFKEKSIRWLTYGLKISVLARDAVVHRDAVQTIKKFKVQKKQQ